MHYPRALHNGLNIKFRISRSRVSLLLVPARKKVSHEETYVSFNKSIGLAGPLSLSRFSSAALRGKVYYSRDKYRPLNHVRRRSETARRTCRAHCNTERIVNHALSRRALTGKREENLEVLVTVFFLRPQNRRSQIG